MESCLFDYRDQFIVLYLEDILVYSKRFEDHLKHIRLIVGRLREKRLKIKASNDILYQRWEAFLCHIV